jgi:hypothetical protein
MQGAKSSEWGKQGFCPADKNSQWLFHSQASQRRKRADALQPCGPGLICAHPFVASRLL